MNGLWQASEGIVGVLGILIAFGIALQIATVRSRQKRRKWSAPITDSPAAAQSASNVSSAVVDAAFNKKAFNSEQAVVGKGVLEAASKGL